MTTPDVRALIELYLQKAVLMQVATVSGSRPWVCSVYFAFDDQLSLYWISSGNRRHSRELRENEHIAGTIVLEHTPGDDVQGLQFEGVAKELTDISEVREGMNCYALRFSMPEDRMNTIIDGKDEHVCYKITPTSFVLFDEVHFPDNARQEYVIQ